MEKIEVAGNFLKRYPWVKFGLIGFVLLFAIGITTAFTVEKEIPVYFDGKEITVKGKLLDPLKAVLLENNLPADSDHVYNPDLNTLLKDVSEVKIQKKYVGKIIVDGKTVSYTSEEKSINEILEENNVIINEEDKVEPSLQTKITGNDTEIRVTRIKTVEAESQKEVPFVAAIVENPSLPTGTKVIVQPGQKGISNVKERIIYENGVEVKRELLEEAVLTPSVEEKTEVGTGTAVADGKNQNVTVDTVNTVNPVDTVNVSVENPSQDNSVQGKTPPESTTGSMMVSATAYTHTGNQTATGTWPQAGRTVAGWPEIVGKTVYIPALGGTFTVEDTGGAVGYGVIDIFMNTEEECIQWGRQNIEVFFVD